jgi:predicted nucleic acid-binding protein
MYQIVLDTNVLVAAMRSKQGASYRLLSLLGDGRWRPNVTVAVVLEYEAVLKRDCLQFGLTEEDVDERNLC